MEQEEQDRGLVVVAVPTTAPADTWSLDELKSFLRAHNAGPLRGRKGDLLARALVVWRDQQWQRWDSFDEASVERLRELAGGSKVKGTKEALRAAALAVLSAELAALSEPELTAALAARGVSGVAPADLAAQLQRKLCERDEHRRVAQLSGVVDIEPPAGVPTITIASWNMANMTPDSRHKKFVRGDQAAKQLIPRLHQGWLFFFGSRSLNRS